MPDSPEADQRRRVRLAKQQLDHALQLLQQARERINAAMKILGE